MNKNNEKVTFKGGAVTLVGNEIKVGDKAENFTVLGAGLNPVTLEDYAGKVKVLSIFPSIDTGVCAMQTVKFNQEAANIPSVEILALSADLPFALGRYCGAEGIDKLTPVSDHKELDFGYKYGFVIEELRLLSRGVVVIDKENIVQHIEYVSEVTNEPDYAAAIEVAMKFA